MSAEERRRSVTLRLAVICGLLGGGVAAAEEAPGLDRESLEIAYELSLMALRNRDKAIEARLISVVRSRSWRMTAPLRRTYARLRRLTGLRQ